MFEFLTFRRKRLSTSSQSGAVLPLTALFFSLMMFIVAFSLDTAIAYSEQSRMQSAADIAARSASQMKATINSVAADQISTGQALAAANGYVNGGPNNTSVNVNPNFPSSFKFSVEVTITNSKPTIFSSILGRAALAHKVRAVAAWDYSPCIVALDGSDANSNSGITISGGTYLNADCGMLSNNTGSQSIKVNGNARIFAALYAVASGGSIPSASLSSLYGTCPENLDCSVNTPNPAPIANIDYTGTQYPNPYTNMPAAPNGDAAEAPCGEDPNAPPISPGYYDDLTPSSGSVNCKLSPGIYYVKQLTMNNGDLIQSAPCVPGSPCGVTIVVTGQGTNNPINITGGELDITATIATSPTDPNFGYNGVAIYSDDSGAMKFTGSFNEGDPFLGTTCADICGINGVVATPNGSITLSGGSSTTNSCVSYIGNDITLSGNVEIGKGCIARSINASQTRSAKLIE